MHVTILHLSTEPKAPPYSDDEVFGDNQDKFPDGVEQRTGADHQEDIKTFLNYLGDAVKTGKTSTHTTIYLDENGNVTSAESAISVEVILNNIAAAAVVIVNKAGAELPSTGGMGTTIFYVLGSVLVLAAVVLLVTKKRMNRG